MEEDYIIMCDSCKHLITNHDDVEGCSTCHKYKTECISWLVFRDYIEDREH